MRVSVRLSFRPCVRASAPAYARARVRAVRRRARASAPTPACVWLCARVTARRILCSAPCASGSEEDA
eukprot:1975198-Pleurochrysis_carterae.AAC.1